MRESREKQTSIMTLVAEALSDLRNYGNEFVRSCGDFDKAKRTGVKQEELADELGINNSAYSQLEKGAMPINAYHLNQICEYFNMPLGDVFAYVDHLKKECEEANIRVVSKKLDWQFDHIRWNKRVEERATTLYNQRIREKKKEGLFKLMKDEHTNALKAETFKQAEKELRAKYLTDEDYSLQHYDHSEDA
ncbi:helix-turn-helix transcriptional regulator [Vibrio parahaemolyticus]|nr:helix-turn-helix transcriptional regulator [Vibrio parahaemolyticus]